MQVPPRESSSKSSFPNDTLDLGQILPNISHSLSGTGFLFGAGTSCEAGYPMMAEMTRWIMGALKQEERNLIDDVLSASNRSYDPNVGSPNIEEIADIVMAQGLTSSQKTLLELETRFRELILECILSVTSPNLDE